MPKYDRAMKPKELKRARARIVCVNFLKGACNFGSGCRYKHDQSRRDRAHADAHPHRRPPPGHNDEPASSSDTHREHERPHAVLDRFRDDSDLDNRDRANLKRTSFDFSRLELPRSSAFQALPATATTGTNAYPLRTGPGDTGTTTTTSSGGGGGGGGGIWQLPPSSSSSSFLTAPLSAPPQHHTSASVKEVVLPFDMSDEHASHSDTSRTNQQSRSEREYWHRDGGLPPPPPPPPASHFAPSAPSVSASSSRMPWSEMPPVQRGPPVASSSLPYDRRDRFTANPSGSGNFSVPRTSDSRRWPDHMSSSGTSASTDSHWSSHANTRSAADSARDHRREHTRSMFETRRGESRRQEQGRLEERRALERRDERDRRHSHNNTSSNNNDDSNSGGYRAGRSSDARLSASSSSSYVSRKKQRDHTDDEEESRLKRSKREGEGHHREKLNEEGGGSKSEGVTSERMEASEKKAEVEEAMGDGMEEYTAAVAETDGDMVEDEAARAAEEAQRNRTLAKYSLAGVLAPLRIHASLLPTHTHERLHQAIREYIRTSVSPADDPPPSLCAHLAPFRLFTAHDDARLRAALNITLSAEALNLPSTMQMHM